MIPIALTTHQPSLASHIENNPPKIDIIPSMNILSETMKSRFDRVSNDMPANIDIIPRDKRRNFPFAPILQVLCTLTTQLLEYINDCFIKIGLFYNFLGGFIIE